MLFSLLTLLPLALAVPHPRGSSDGDLNCVIQQYIPPFTDTGFNGFIYLYANVTTFDSASQTTSFNETRLGLSEDGTIQNCGDCRSTQQFAVEVCETKDRYAYKGLKNSAHSFYGHILYTTDQTNLKCLTATAPFNGSSVTVSDCQYDYENVGASGQYFEITVGEEGTIIAQLAADEEGQYYGTTYGVNPEIGNGDGGKLTFLDAPAGGPFTYLGFKGREF